MNAPGASGGSLSRPLAMLIALAVAALSLAATAFDAERRGAVSRPEALDAATERVRTGFAAGDAVVTAPFWDHGAWQRLTDMGPGTDAYPFPALLRSDLPDPLSILAHARLWVIGAEGRAPLPPASVRSVATPIAESEIDAQTRVALWALPQVTPLRTMTEDFDRLVVRRRHPSGEIDRCPRRGDRHRCGREPWFDLHIQDRDVYHQDVSWLFAHPGPDAIALEIDWPKLPGGAWLVLRAGFTQAGVRHAEGKDVTITVQIDGAEAGSLVLAPHKYWLGRAIYELPRDAALHKATIIVATAEHGWRELMMQGDLLAEVPEVIRQWAAQDP